MHEVFVLLSVVIPCPVLPLACLGALSVVSVTVNSPTGRGPSLYGTPGSMNIAHSVIWFRGKLSDLLFLLFCVYQKLSYLNISCCQTFLQ